MKKSKYISLLLAIVTVMLMASVSQAQATATATVTLTVVPASGDEFHSRLKDRYGFCRFGSPRNIRECRDVFPKLQQCNGETQLQKPAKLKIQFEAGTGQDIHGKGVERGFQRGSRLSGELIPILECVARSGPVRIL